MKRIGSLLCLLMISGCAALRGKPPACEEGKTICALSRCDASGCRIYAINKSLYPVSMKISMKTKNLTRPKGDTNTFVLKPGEASLRHSLMPWDSYQSFSIEMKYSWLRGAFDVQPDTQYVYRLPYEAGKPMYVNQGYDGKTTHNGPQRYAIDFGLAPGTDVYSAREGIVIDAVERNDTACFQVECDKFVNYIDVLHSDGTIADYAHLAKDGALVAVGDTIARGQKIGISGNTGRSQGPHLHFMVSKAVSDTAYTTIPTRFLVGEGVASTLKEGDRYKAP